MCGVIGIASQANLGVKVYSSLSKLQHRGQDGWGITNGKITEKYSGLIKENFPLNSLSEMTSGYGLGHTRYLTQGKHNLNETQPFMKNNMSFVHNGNIINKREISEILEHHEINVSTTSDSELLFNLVCLFCKFHTLVEAIKVVQKVCKGSFFVIMIIEDSLVCFKDNDGIRPGMWYRKDDDIIICSENCGVTESVTDIKGGEIMIVKNKSVETFNPNYPLKPCVFEYIYLAHPASTLYGISVYSFRVKLAEKLASLITFHKEIDFVSIIPDSSRTYGIELANNLVKEYKEVIIKNNYSIRTFIMPQGEREKNVNKKFYFVDSEIKGKSILIVDDSIVRGTTAKHVIKELRKRGAKKVFMVSCAPIVNNYNSYGIKIDSKRELLSYNKTVERMRQELECDKLIFQTLDNLYSILPFKVEDSIFI